MRDYSLQPSQRSPTAHARRLMVPVAAFCLPNLMATAAWAESESTATKATTTETAQTADAAAEKGDPKKKAKEHFATGLKFYEDSDYALALIEFERAYSYVPDFRVLYNIGQVSIQLGRYARAAQALEQYLSGGGSKIPSARVKAVQSDLAMLEGRTARLTVKCNVEGADILLDDALLGKTPMTESILVDAGEHRVVVQKSGYVSRTEPLVLAGRDESTLQFDLTEERPVQTISQVPVVVTTPLAQPNPFLATPQGPAPRKSELLYVGWGATGLLALGWAVTGYMGITAAKDLHTAMQYTATESDLHSREVKARRWLLAADIVGAATLVTGGTTLYFTLKHPSREQTVPKSGVSSLGLGFGSGSAQLFGSF